MEAQTVLREVWRRLVDPMVLPEALHRFAATSRHARFSHWSAASLGFGGAGIALLGHELGDVRTGHDLLRQGAAQLGATTSPGLFDGDAGYGLVVSLAGGPGAYRTLRAQLDSRLLPAITRAVKEIGPGPAESTRPYDLVSGLAGYGAYLRTGFADDRDAAVDAVSTECDRLFGAERPNLVVAVEPEAGFPAGVTGYLDCGMAHGLAGLIAMRAVTGVGGVDNLERATEWLAAQHFRADGTIRWPRRILLDDAGAAVGTTPPGTGWCYGTAGIARALWLSAVATGRRDHRALALEAFDAVTAEPPPESPTLCHGLAGLLMIALEFAHDTGSGAAKAFCHRLTDLIIDRYEPQSVVGFRDREPDGALVENPGLLNGSTGVALALSAALSGRRRPWSRALLVS